MMRIVMEGAKAHMTENKMKTRHPICITALRPKISAILPLFGREKMRGARGTGGKCGN